MTDTKRKHSAWQLDGEENNNLLRQIRKYEKELSLIREEIAHMKKQCLYNADIDAEKKSEINSISRAQSDLISQLCDNFAPLIKSLVEKFKDKGFEKEDLHGICMQRFLERISIYDPDTNPHSFQKVVYLDIRSKIKKTLANRNMLPGFPLWLYEVLNKISIVWNQLYYEANYEREISVAEVANALSVDVEVLDKLLLARTYKANRFALSLDQSISEEGDMGFASTIQDHNSPDVYNITKVDSLREEIPLMAESLTSSEKSILALKYGVKSLYGIIFDEITNEHPSVLKKIKKLDTKVAKKKMKDKFETFFDEKLESATKPMPRALKRNLGLE